MADTKLDRFVRRASWLDGLMKFVKAILNGITRVLGPLARPLGDLAHGTRILGHPLHPALSDVPLGGIVGVVALDIGSHYGYVTHNAATLLLWVAVVGGVLSAITGYVDYRSTFGAEGRAATLHSLLMGTSLLAMLVSLGWRTLGHDNPHSVAVVLDAVALAVMGSGAFVGGHLVFVMGVSINRTAFLDASKKSVDVGALDDFQLGKPTRVSAGKLDVLVTRRADAVCAIANVCSHAGGPLSDGTLDEQGIHCPWHDSVFDVCTGRVVHGPATVAQPAMDVEVQDGRVLVKPKVPFH